VVRAGSRVVFEPDAALPKLAAAFAVLTIVGFAVAAIFRATFPYPFEVQEDTSVQLVRRLAEGQPMYAQPTLEYVAAVYAPLYFQLSAIVAREYDYVLWEPQSEAFALKYRIEGAGYVDIGPLFPENDLFDQWKSGYTPDVDVYVPKERAPTTDK
jgi:hypothetical protein